MEKILKFTLDTPINAFQYLAYSSGILMADENKNRYEWLISYSLRVYHNGNNLGIYLPGELPSLFNEVKGSAYDCFERHQVDLPAVFTVNCHKELINIIKNMIDNEFYVHGFYNEYYIKNRHAYHRENLLHDYLIIGYNDIDEIFYIPGYTDQYVYEIGTVSFDSFIKANAFNQESNGHLVINFYQVKKDFSFAFNMPLARKSVKEFIHSTDYSIYKDHNVLYGKEALRYFQKEHLDQEFRYVQNIKAYSDYVNCVVSFFEYLVENNIVKENELLRKARVNQNKCKALAYMIIKFIVTGDSKILDKTESIKYESVENLYEIMTYLDDQLNQ